MGTAIADILPLAVGVAISVMAIIAVILMLFSKQARSTSVGFLIGWFLGVTVVLMLVVLIANPAQQATGSEESLLYAIVHLVLGLFLLFVAYRDWKKRPKPGEVPEMPKWMSSIDSFTAGKALGMGVLLSGLNPKNLALILSAGVAIAAAGLTSSETIIVLVIFIVIACISVATPVIAYLVLGEKAESTLNSWKVWLIQNNAAVMTVVFLLFGVKLLADGLGALIGG